MADNIKQELDDYKESLAAARQRLVDYGKRQGEIRFEHTSQDGVLIVAIDGLLTQLDAAKPEEITLNAIVELSDNINNVLKSANMFFQNKQVRESPISSTT